MNPSKLIKIVIPILFTLALALGFFQREEITDFLKPQAAITYFKNASTDSLSGYYQKSQDIIRGNNKKKTVTFLAVGDIMLSRTVAGTMAKASDPLLPFSNMTDILKATDFNFGNLESPISGRNDFNPTGSLVFNVPEKYTAGLKTYNFQILNLANNHALDQGKEGLFHTMDFLDTLGIKHVGTGKNLEEAWRPAIIESNGIKICFIGASYSSVNDSGQTKNNFVARIEDVSNLKSSILNLQSTCDFTVVTMHAGTEYTRKPNQSQIDFAHKAIDAGADMVIGAHPHWIQTIEKYCPNSLSNSPSTIHGEGARGEVTNTASCSTPKYIFYSLGNFIFDQEWSQDTKEGLALKIKISDLGMKNSLQGPKVPATLDSIELIPVVIENYSTPRPATPEESKKILEKIGETRRLLK